MNEGASGRRWRAADQTQAASHRLLDVSGKSIAVHNDILEELLRSFPETEYLGRVGMLAGGASGAPVLAAEFRRLGAGGLHGTYIVKVGSSRWAESERILYQQSAKSLGSVLAPIRSWSRTIDGYSAVAYSIAFSSILRTRTMRQLLLEGSAMTAEARGHIKRLSRHLVQRAGAALRESTEPLALHTHIALMLGSERMADVHDRLKMSLPGIYPSRMRLHIDALNRLLPNPIAYLDASAWGDSGLKWVCPRGHMHGDLNTGNVMCLPGTKECPKVIDFADHRTDGHPLFDLAYLEFDVLQQVLDVESTRSRHDWIHLFKYSMSDLLPNGEPRRGKQVADAWTLIRPIRKQVAKLRDKRGGIHHDKCEIAWWLATVAVGVNFARKGQMTRPPMQRVLGLLYAAFGLERLLETLYKQNLITPPRYDASPVTSVPWIEWPEEWARGGSPGATARPDATSESQPRPEPTVPADSQPDPVKRFERTYDDYSRRALEIQLSVFIWQPYPEDNQIITRVRYDIWKGLQRRGFTPLPEDLPVPSRRRGREMDQALLMIERADLVIVLADERHISLEQTSPLVRDATIIGKALWFLPRQLDRRDWPQLTIPEAWGAVSRYTEQDLTLGTLVKQSLQWAENRRFYRLFNGG